MSGKRYHQRLLSLLPVVVFLGGVLETEAAFSVMEKDVCGWNTGMLTKAVHSCKFVCCGLDPIQQDFGQKFESELKDLWSAVVETQKEIVKIFELLFHQERDSFHSIK